MYMLELKNCVRKSAGDWIALPIAGVAGAFTNTPLVMNLIYICFSSEFASAKNIALDAVYGVILTIIATNGVPEAIVARYLQQQLEKYS